MSSSHLMKINITALPSTTPETIFSVWSDKSLFFKVTPSGGFVVTSSTTATAVSLFSTSEIKMAVSKWYWVKISWVRGQAALGAFDCSVSIKVSGFKEEGGYIDCKLQEISPI